MHTVFPGLRKSLRENGISTRVYGHITAASHRLRLQPKRAFGNHFLLLSETTLFDIINTHQNDATIHFLVVGIHDLCKMDSYVVKTAG